MAKSPSHQFGSLIGGMWEEAVEPILAEYCRSKPGLFLDKKGARKSRKGKKLLRWVDDAGNHHSLDYVIEKGGTDDQLGRLAAIIELAWRSYTKHSKAKVQEIEGAVTPIFRKYKDNRPFIAAVLSGDFTKDSLIQLKSHGFFVHHSEKPELGKVFAAHGIDIVIGENAPDEDFEKQISIINSLNIQERIKLINDVTEFIKPDLDKMVKKMDSVIFSPIDSIYVAANFGEGSSFNNVSGAMEYISSYDETTNKRSIFTEYYITIIYKEGNKVEIRAKDKISAQDFLEKFL